MRLIAFSVFDSKAEAFLRPFFTETVGLATRAISDAANDTTSEMHRHAEDYTLFQVGHFDQDKGVLEPLDLGPKVVVTMISLKET